MDEIITEMSWDLETYSEADLKKTGVYRYAEDPSFEILLAGVSINGGPVHCYDLASGEKLPDEIIRALTDEHVIKWAFNASFERICLSIWLRKNYPQYFKGYGVPDDPLYSKYLDPASWRCPLLLSAYNGPHDSPEKWSLFKKYNIRDVEVEMQIHERLKNYMVPDSVWKQYFIDQQINDRGIMIDPAVVENAIRIDAEVKEALTKKLQALTDLPNPNSVLQMKEWLSRQGYDMDSLGKKEVQAAIADAQTPEIIRKVLSLRLMLAKSSVKKYQAMQNSACADSRCHGMFMFYGANRSGRWAGRIVQLQNLPQNHMDDLDEARSLVRSGDFETLSLLYDNIPNVLSELIRTAFVPRPGYSWAVADFSAVEARCLSYLAGEDWRTEVFKNNGDIYCASASAMFHVPVEKHGVNANLRQKGKIAELALGYGGGKGALISMGALTMGLSEDELQPLVDKWRSSNPHIVQYWWRVDRAVKEAIKHHTIQKVGQITILVKSGMLFIELPSGRHLSYVKPAIGENRFGGESVTYFGIDDNRIESYGPKFVENITQAICRDILCNAMQNLSDQFICGHVHDELLIEVPDGTPFQPICDRMAAAPD